MSERKDRPGPKDASSEEDVVLVEAPSETLEEILAQQEAEAEKEASAASSMGDSLKRVESELAEMRDRHLRKIAEFENFRKRTEREKADYFKFALNDVFRDLLPVLDNFERALSQGGRETGDEYRQGIELIYRQLADALAKRGLKEVPAEGAFDPNIHEAVAREETNAAPPNSVLEVLQKGYFLNDRLLRPAFVKVSTPPADGRSES
jgi:molecular chaperone GrpE